MELLSVDEYHIYVFAYHVQGGKTMVKTLTKQALFGVPSLETAGRIDDSDKVSGLAAAHYRCSERLRELESQFEAKASEPRGVHCGSFGNHRPGSGGVVSFGLPLSGGRAKPMGFQKRGNE
jgi:hypothetical protein